MRDGLRELRAQPWAVASTGLRLVPIAIAALVAGVLELGGNQRMAAPLALAAIVAAGLMLHVELPWGGRLTLGHAVLVALVVEAEPTAALAIAGGGVLLALPAWLRDDDGPLRVRAGGVLALMAATGSAALVRASMEVFRTDELWRLDADVLLVVQAAIVGTAFLAVDHLGRQLVADVDGDDLRRAWPLYLTILCVAALVDVALRRSVALAFIASVPLLVTRYSFQRYTSAQRTYAQTTQALSLLPEVAGLTPLGHAERTAVYAGAVAGALDFDADRVHRVVTAARLHHIGHISQHEPEERSGPPDPQELAAATAEILTQTGFLEDLAGVVGAAQPGGPPSPTLDAAVVRVCSTLDDIVESGASVDVFASLVALYPLGHERSVAIELAGLHHRRPNLVGEAKNAVSAFTLAAASGGEHAHDH